jgi:hypothetical protein
MGEFAQLPASPPAVTLNYLVNGLAHRFIFLSQPSITLDRLYTTLAFVPLIQPINYRTVSPKPQYPLDAFNDESESLLRVVVSGRGQASDAHHRVSHILWADPMLMDELLLYYLVEPPRVEARIDRRRLDGDIRRLRSPWAFHLPREHPATCVDL